MKHERHFNNLGNKHSLVMIFVDQCYVILQKFISENSMKNSCLETSS